MSFLIDKRQNSAWGGSFIDEIKESRSLLQVVAAVCCDRRRLTSGTCILNRAPAPSGHVPTAVPVTSQQQRQEAGTICISALVLGTGHWQIIGSQAVK